MVGLAMGLALAGRHAFLKEFSSFILFLPAFFTRWSVINLVDYYFTSPVVRSQRDVLDQSRMHRADPAVNKVTSAFRVSKIEPAALRALPHGAAVIGEKMRCDGGLGGPIINFTRQVLPITRLGIIVHNERADFLKTLFVERNRL
jgi:purine-cytosine permease-like protein